MEYKEFLKTRAVSKDFCIAKTHDEMTNCVRYKAGILGLCEHIFIVNFTDVSETYCERNLSL